MRFIRGNVIAILHGLYYLSSPSIGRGRDVKFFRQPLEFRLDFM